MSSLNCLPEDKVGNHAEPELDQGVDVRGGEVGVVLVQRRHAASRRHSSGVGAWHVHTEHLSMTKQWKKEHIW